MIRSALVVGCCVLTACSTVRSSWAIADPSTDTRRTTTSGEVIGGPGRYGSHAWLGIPFAAPPVGPLRWRAPQPPAGADRLPAMVWIHGGANSLGNAAGYDLGHLASGQRVLGISVHYRLGPLGWFRNAALRTDEPLDDSGNYGTLDLILARQWVRDNAAAFGGNPDDVTIFGESAGGQNVYSLLLSPPAKGLFHRAIAQSPVLSRATLVGAENFTDDPAGAGHPNRCEPSRWSTGER